MKQEIMSRLWASACGRPCRGAPPRMDDAPLSVEGSEIRRKSLAALLELAGCGLHDETICTLECRYFSFDGWFGYGCRGFDRKTFRFRTGGILDSSHGDRGGPHGRRRGFHQPRVSGQGPPLGLFDPAAMAGRRGGRVMRRLRL